MKKNDAAKRRDHELIRNRVGFIDFTMGLIEIGGAEARNLLDEVCVNDLAALKPGQVIYTSLLNEEAMIIDDLTVFCFSDERFWMVTATQGSTLIWLEEHRGQKSVSFEDLSDKIALWTIQGPDSRRLLVSYLDRDISSLGYYNFVENRAGGIPIIVSRTGFTGELGFEIFVDKTRAELVIGDLTRAGRRFGARVLETDAGFESIPTEKGLLVSRDFSGTNPMEVGLAWSVKWDKKFFIGQDKLKKIKEAGVSRKLKGFVCENDEVDIANGSLVKVKGSIVGKVTTANYGYTVEKSIGYCMLDAQQAENGTEITIESEQGKLKAIVCDRVFYDQARVKVMAEMTEPCLPRQRTEEYINGGREKLFKGLHGAIPTPFLRDESLDKAALKRLVDFLATSGLDGILLGGSSGEYPMQSEEERKALFGAAAEAVDGRLKITACCGANSTREVKALCAQAGAVGLDYALIMTPFDPPVSEAVMVDFYKEIGCYSKPGVIIYHYPAYTGVQLSTEAVLELAREPNIVGIKDVADLTNTVPIINGSRGQNFGTLTGTDEVVLGALASGADGFMGVGGCVAPGLCRELFNSFYRGDLEKAQDCHRKLCRIMKVVFDGNFPGTLKAAMELQGLDCGRPRKPAAAADFLTRRMLQCVLSETGILK